MAITPNSDIRIIKVPISIDNKNQITFSSKQAQEEYFKSLPYIEMDNCTYQRKDSVIRFNAHIDDIIEYNYVMYKNNNYSDKYFYAFITGMEYVNNNTTYIYITTDVFQTWQFDFTFKESFIEREMISVSEDVPGANLIPEGLEIGEPKVEGTAEFDELEPVYVVAFSGDKFQENNINKNGYQYNGIYSSVAFILTNITGTALGIINQQGDGDKILTVFSVPKLAVASQVPEDTEGTHYYYAKILESNKENPIVKTLVSTPSNLDGYTPKNQKLRTYPYTYLGFNPSNGSQKIYRYEDFTNGTPSFKLISEVNPNPSVYFIPQNYRGSSGDSMSDIASLNGYPTISFKNDVYNTWLAQNSEIMSIQMQQEQFNYEVNAVKGGINTVGNLIGNAVSGDVGGALTGSINSGVDLASNDVNHEFYIQNMLAQVERQKLLPDNANLSSSNATLLGYELADKNIFTRYTIKSQFARRIDKFFDMYGYLTNEVKVPNLNNRPNWNYVKTIGANIIADIPQNDLQTLKNLFDSGITLWHNTNTFLDYSQNNR